MSLHIRSRPEYGPAARLRPVTSTFLRELRQDSMAADPEDMEIGPELPMSSLPILATANDAREVVRFLKKRPNGVTVVEAMNAEPRRIFDARKIAAYEFWGIICRENERLALTALGHELADALEPECRLQRNILHRVPAYQIALKNIFEERLDIATHLDVLRHWSQLKTINVEHGNSQDLEAAVVCFFSVCHAAELGTATVGKRGQPARLRVDMEQVAAFLSEQPELAPTILPSPRRDPVPRPSLPLHQSGIRQVLVSTSGNEETVENLTSLLSLAGFTSRTVDFANFQNGLIPNSELSEMQQCQAGIFLIGPDDCVRQKDGTLSLRHEWITKISVAAALFDWRILLFWNGTLPPPDELMASGLSLVSNEKLDWEASLDLVNQIKELAFPASE